jgi:D-xylose transport system permease protein
MAILWVGAVVAVLIFLMNRTVFGRNAFLVGSSREAALYAGIDVKKTVFTGFVIMGGLYGIAGVLITARLGSSTPGLGQFLELDAIAAAVIGGVSLRGGAGSIMGAVMGAFLLTTINNGMSILNVPSFAQLVIKAIILLLALAFDAQVVKRRR